MTDLLGKDQTSPSKTIASRRKKPIQTTSQWKAQKRYEYVRKNPDRKSNIREEDESKGGKASFQKWSDDAKKYQSRGSGYRGKDHYRGEDHHRYRERDHYEVDYRDRGHRYHDKRDRYYSGREKYYSGKSGGKYRGSKKYDQYRHGGKSYRPSYHERDEDSYRNTSSEDESYDSRYDEGSDSRKYSKNTERSLSHDYDISSKEGDHTSSYNDSQGGGYQRKSKQSTGQ